MAVSNREFELTETRLEALPSKMKLAVLGKGTFTKEQLLAEVRKKSDIGRLFAEQTMKGIRSYRE